LLLEELRKFTEMVPDALFDGVGDQHRNADGGARGCEAERADQEVATV
jgi:hypothetical protein